MNLTASLNPKQQISGRYLGSSFRTASAPVIEDHRLMEKNRHVTRSALLAEGKVRLLSCPATTFTSSPAQMVETACQRTIQCDTFMQFPPPL